MQYTVGRYHGVHWTRQPACEVFPHMGKQWLYFSWLDQARTDIEVCGVSTQRELFRLIDEQCRSTKPAER